jgi:hypothetical protein
LSVNIADPKVGKALLPLDMHIAGPLAERGHCGIRFEQQPLLKQGAPV